MNNRTTNCSATAYHIHFAHAARWLMTVVLALPLAAGIKSAGVILKNPPMSNNRDIASGMIFYGRQKAYRSFQAHCPLQYKYHITRKPCTGGTDMQFYRIDGLIQERKKPSETGGLQTARERRTKIALKADEFNQKFQKKAFFFVTVLSESILTAGVICREPLELTDKIEAFLSQLNIDLKEIHRTEVTLSTICNMLQSAWRTGYMENDDEDILEQFDLISLTGRYGRMISYDEEMIEETGRPQVYKVAEKFLVRESLIPELGRIYAGKSRGRAEGHPVHYMIQTDDWETRRGVCDILLKALYANERLHSRRFSYLCLRPGRSFSRAAYDCLYKSSIGGAVLVRYITKASAEDKDHADGGRETIEIL